jgi:transcription elongation GreA/GreB family factor
VTAQAIEDLVEAVAASSGGEDALVEVTGENAFVEVGDRVTYYLMDDPNIRHSVLILNSESNPEMGIVNEQTPLARALLDLSPGESGELEVAGQKNRQLRVINVQRQEELLA